jgi:ABC-type glycerol-3-phosphate transport system substrate-binding protein
MDADTLSGDPVNDAIFNRNSFVENQLGISITVNDMGYNEIVNTVLKLYNAGDNEYDIVYDEAWAIASLAKQGCFIPVGDCPDALNTSMTWWSENALESLTIGNKLYMLMGDMNLMFMESAWAVSFNKGILRDRGYTDLYGLVDSGKWTMEKMSEIMTAAATDLNGNGMDSGDIWGAVTYYGVVNPLIKSSGLYLVTRDANSLPVYLGADEKLFDVYNKIVKMFYDNDSVVYNNKVSLTCPGLTDWPSLFYNGNSAFMLEVMGGIRKLRSYDIDFGIVPMPKYDESQDSYITLTAHYAAGLAIPSQNPDLVRTCTIIENLGAYSYKWLRGAYYEKTLEGKVANDTESAKMLNIIYQNPVFELDLIYSFQISETIKNSAIDKSTNLKSALEAKKKVIDRLISDLNKYYTE